MFVIRERQLSAMIVAMRGDYLTSIAKYVREHLPECTRALDDAALETRVGAALERAAAHGVEIEWDLCRFTCLELVYGPDFDARCAWAARILADPARSGADKINHLESYHVNYLERAGGAGL